VVEDAQGASIVMSERPLKGMSENPSVQQLPEQHLAVLQQNLGEVIEVSVSTASAKAVLPHAKVHHKTICV